MRKILVILALSAATAAAAATDVSAQGLFRGRRLGLGIGVGNYYGPGYYGSGFGSGIGMGFGSGYYGSGYGSPYYNGSGYGTGYYSAPYYNGIQYYNNTPITQAPVSPIRQSSYFEPAPTQQSASVIVRVPRTDAKVWFDGALTSQQGMERAFHSPPLQPGGNYTYTIRSSWMENGKTIERDRNVQVRPGQTVTVDFRAASVEDLQSPTPVK